MEERKRLYENTRNDLLARQLSNAEHLDKAILSLSSAGLAFSLAFIKDVVQLPKAGFLSLLHYSWYMFGAAVITTLLSYYSSQLGIDRQLIFAERYYLKCQEDSLKRTRWGKVTIWLNYLAGVFFIVAVTLTITFVSLNVRR